MVQGPVEKKIIKRCMAEKLPLPEAIRNAPNLFMGLELYMQGFNDLDSARTIGMAEGPIPWNAVEEYCRLNEFDEEQTTDMHYYIKEMDAVFLEERSKKNS